MATTSFLHGPNLAAGHGYDTFRAWVIAVSAAYQALGYFTYAWDNTIDAGPTALVLRIDFGRYIADCPYCAGAEYVDLDDPFFFCLSCGNNNTAKAINVTIPAEVDRLAIETELLLRPVDESRGRGANARPIYPPIPQTWNGIESADDLETARLSHMS